MKQDVVVFCLLFMWLGNITHSPGNRQASRNFFVPQPEGNYLDPVLRRVPWTLSRFPGSWTSYGLQRPFWRPAKKFIRTLGPSTRPNGRRCDLSDAPPQDFAKRCRVADDPPLESLGRWRSRGKTPLLAMGGWFLSKGDEPLQARDSPPNTGGLYQYIFILG